MTKEKILGLLVLLMLIGLPATTATTINTTTQITTFSDILYVGGSGPNNYTAIQPAIDDVVEGGTIYVYCGFYYGGLSINKSLTLIGENRDITIIDGNDSYTVIKIFADNVQINSFTIQKENSECTAVANYIGDNNTLINNKFPTGGSGLHISTGNNNISIIGNVFIKTGIELFSTLETDEKHHTIKGNTLEGKPIIYLEDEANYYIDYPIGQLILNRCDNITLVDQLFKAKSSPLQIKDSTNILLYDCQSQWTVGGPGLNLVSCSNVTVENCTFTGCATGINLHYCQDCIITRSNIYNNIDGGIKLQFSALCTITENNFRSNLYNAFMIFCKFIEWNNNFWNRPRLFPKIIFGFPRLSIDMSPARSQF